MKHRILHIIIFICLMGTLSAQPGMLNRHNPAYDILDRIHAKYQLENKYHSAIRYQKLSGINDDLIKIIQSDLPLTKHEKKDLAYVFNMQFPALMVRLKNDSVVFPEWIRSKKGPFLKHFYKSRSNFLEYVNKDFLLTLNPVIHFGLGRDLDQESNIFQNTRGMILSGFIDQRIYFYTSIYENQRNFLSYIERNIVETKAIPGQGFYKSYQSDLLKGFSGYDYLNAEAHIGMQLTRSISSEFGHGKFFIGNGIRSLLLSDYSHNYLYLTFNTILNKIHYQNIFAELSTVSAASLKGDVLLPKKYMAAHYLSYQVHPKLEIGLFESIIFNRERHFEFHYLNPVILYRTVEQFIGSPDNILIGLNFNAKTFPSLSLYGQALIDEFKLKEIIQSKGWWGNKYGLQLGLKYFDVGGIDHLFFQLEGNMVRPFTYSHRDSLQSYTHYHQPLAHPLGANFNELIFSASYFPVADLQIKASAVFAGYAYRYDDENWGSNLLLSSDTRTTEYGHSIGQGIAMKMFQYKMQLSYQCYDNYFIDLHTIIRQEKNVSEKTKSSNLFIGTSFRMNIMSDFPDY